MTTYCHSREVAIQPFTIAISDGELDDLCQRLGRARWPDTLPDTSWDYGVPPAYLHELAD